MSQAESNTKDLLISILLLPILACCIIVIYFIFNCYGPAYLDINLNEPKEFYENVEIAFFILILPSLFAFSLLAFGILTPFVIFIIQGLDFDVDEDDIYEILTLWCPTVMVLLFLVLRFLEYPTINFLNRYEYFGLAIVMMKIIGISRIHRKKEN